MHLLREEWEPLEADFTRYYSADLRALCWGKDRWSARRILGHIRALPPDCATVRRHMTPEQAWDTTHELLAGLFDAMQRHTAIYMQAHGVDTALPAPLPRPGQEPPEIPTVSLTEWAATL